MSRSKGKRDKSGRKTTSATQANVVENAAKAIKQKPVNAIDDLGDHYSCAAGERPPANQYESTTTTIINHTYSKGYHEAAETMEAGADVLPRIPTAPSRPTIDDIMGPNTAKKTEKKDAGTFAMLLDEWSSDEEDDEVKVEMIAEKSELTATEQAVLIEQTFETLKAIHAKEIDQHVKAKANLTKGKVFAIRVIMAQCSSNMHAILNSREGFRAARQEGDVVKVLQHVKTACYDFNVAGDEVNTLWHALFRLVNTRQRTTESRHEYMERLMAAMQRFEQAGGSVSGLIAIKKSDRSISETKHRRQLVQRFAAMMAFQQSDNTRYGGLKTDYYNDNLAGVNKYPTTWNAVANLLDNAKVDKKQELSDRKPEGGDRTTTPGARSFANRAPPGGNTFTVPSGHAFGTDGSYHPRIECHICKKVGHYANDCPTGNDASDPQKDKSDKDDDDGEPTAPGATPTKGKSLYLFARDDEDGGDEDDDYEGERSGLQFAMKGYARSVDFLKANGVDYWSRRKDGMKRLTLLLDSGSTHNIIKDIELVTKVWNSKVCLEVETNGGTYEVKRKARMPGVGTVWYSPESAINVLSLKQINSHKNFKVCFKGEDDEPHFLVTNKLNGMEMKFGEVGDIYVKEILIEQENGGVNNKINDKGLIGAYSMSNVATVEANKRLFSNRQAKNADKVGPLLATLSYPSKRDLILMIRKRMIKDCPVTVNDVKRYYQIYGNSEGAVKGKTVRRRPEEVTTEHLVDIPKSVMKQHKEITLCADLFFIDGFPYLTTISKGIMFSTVEMMENRKFNTLLDGLLGVISFYKVKGFKVNYVFTDNEFKPMREALQDEGKTDLNCSAPNEHVQPVERNIKTIKERVRSLIHGMPYKRLPKNLQARTSGDLCDYVERDPEESKHLERVLPKGNGRRENDRLQEALCPHPRRLLPCT